MCYGEYLKNIFWYFVFHMPFSFAILPKQLSNWHFVTFNWREIQFRKRTKQVMMEIKHSVNYYDYSKLNRIWKNPPSAPFSWPYFRPATVNFFTSLHNTPPCLKFLVDFLSFKNYYRNYIICYIFFLTPPIICT